MADGREPTTVRIRGIYATALTEWLRQAATVTVVDPSPPIEARFETTFETADPDVVVEMTDDRLGVSVAGVPAGVETVTNRIESVGVDSFTWAAPLPKGAILDGRVDRTDGRGVIVTAGEHEGYLPGRDGGADLERGDAIRVQVSEPVPPWTDSRPRLSTTIEVPGELASLVKGVDATVADTPRGAAGQELARTTELLSTTIPAEWGVKWGRGAVDADMSTLETALNRVVEQADTIEDALGAEQPSDTDSVVARPWETVWFRFGRGTRFALDDQRAAATETITGHHRIKAGSESAGSAVDFVEALGQDLDGFPFGAVTEAFGPIEGETVRIVHGKPEGEEFALGSGTVTDRSVAKSRVTVEREMQSEGTYDAIGTSREPGDTATTRFAEGRWWYPTVYRGESGANKGTYVNIATPVEVFPTEIRYVDLHVDVIKHPIGTVEIVDEDELAAARKTGHVPDAVAERATETASKVASILED